jgi:hypothetical protein
MYSYVVTDNVSRELVRVGELGLCADGARSGGEEAAFAVWKGSGSVYHLKLE